MTARLIVIPSWIALLAFAVACASAYVASESVSSARLSQRNLVACEARAQATLMSATTCNAHLTSCLGSVAKIADELELSEVTF